MLEECPWCDSYESETMFDPKRLQGEVRYRCGCLITVDIHRVEECEYGSS